MPLVYYFAQVDRPFPEVASPVMALAGQLNGWADRAYREGERLTTRVGLGGKTPGPFAKSVHISVGRPVQSERQIVIPLGWQATGTPSLFPSLEADLIVTALGPDLTQVSLRGSYDPPLGMVGKAIDRAVLHRVAELTMKGFVDRVAEELNRGSPDLAVGISRRSDKAPSV